MSHSLESCYYAITGQMIKMAQRPSWVETSDLPGARSRGLRRILPRGGMVTAPYDTPQPPPGERLSGWRISRTGMRGPSPSADIQPKFSPIRKRLPSGERGPGATPKGRPVGRAAAPVAPSRAMASGEAMKAFGALKARFGTAPTPTVRRPATTAAQKQTLGLFKSTIGLIESHKRTPAAPVRAPAAAPAPKRAPAPSRQSLPAPDKRPA